MAATEQDARALIARLDERAERIDAPFEDARIRWRRIGSGPPLLLVHGGHGTWLHWVRNIDALAAAHTLWLPDLPGCGDSDEVAPPATLERLVAALHANVDALVGPQTALAIAAFSFGSTLATNLAVARGHVTRMALLGATGHGLPRRRVELRNWRELPAGAAQDDAHRHNLARQMLHDPDSVDTLALVIHRDASERTRLRSKPISLTSVTRQALDRLSIPVLMAWGEHDPTASGADTAHAMADGHPNRQWLVIPGAGHWLQYERADAVNQLLRSWFG